MKNFGLLKDKKIDWTDELKLGKELLKTHLFEEKISAIGTGMDVVDGLLTLKCNPNVLIIDPTKEFVYEFYDYAILKVFKVLILEFKLKFFKNFNDSIYGLSKKKQKQIALEFFNNIYDEVYEDIISLFDNTTSENGIELTLNKGKLSNLFHQYEAYKYNVLQKIKGNKYLLGDEQFFKQENLLHKYDIQRELEFEIQLQIMVELNDRFGFEEDFYFTKNRILKNFYENNKHIFNDFETYKYTHNKIESFEKHHKAKVESLYAALLNKKLIFDHRENFVKYLSDVHKINVSKLINYEEMTNYDHDERVRLFSEEIESLTLKND